LPLDSEVFLTLRLPATSATIETKGRVAWTWDMRKGTAHLIPGMGIRLVDTEPLQRQQLEAYLSQLTKTEERLSAV
jgi:Tfp pilus assembly protein PilZ